MCACMSASVYAHVCGCTACETSTRGQKADAAPNRTSSTIKPKDHILEYVGIRMQCHPDAEGTVKLAVQLG
jgi:hypothetical protein